MIWLDGLDAPLVRMLESAFQEYFPEERQPQSVTRGTTYAGYGRGPLRPAWQSGPPTEHSPLMHYPWSSTRQALVELANLAQGSPYDGVIMEYTNPTTGGAVMLTMGCHIQMLKPGQRTQAHRHTSATIYHVVEGRGASIVGGHSLDWEHKDVFCVPGWTTHQHLNASATEPAFLFSFTDAPALKALGLLREEPMPGEWG
jgi:gentisate 1,2-dioxygenase